MTNEEKKARELVDMFHITKTHKLAKQCALICVEEIIENEKVDNVEGNNLSYWQTIKQIIEKL